MVTVRELEHELNVSRVSLYAILKKEQFKSHVVKGSKNIMMVNDIGADMLRKYYFGKIRGGTPRSSTKDAAAKKDSPEENDYIGILESQLAKKDEQIDSLLNIVSKNKLA